MESPQGMRIHRNSRIQKYRLNHRTLLQMEPKMKKSSVEIKRKQIHLPTQQV